MNYSETMSRFDRIVQRVAPAEPVPIKRSGLLRRALDYCLRRYAVRNARLRVCETLPLGGRRSLALIECDGERFLAGLSSDGVHTIVPIASSRNDGEAA